MKRFFDNLGVGLVAISMMAAAIGIFIGSFVIHPIVGWTLVLLVVAYLLGAAFNDPYGL